MAEVSFGETEVKIFKKKLSFSFLEIGPDHLDSSRQRRQPMPSRQDIATKLSRVAFYRNEDATTHHLQYIVYCKFVRL